MTVPLSSRTRLPPAWTGNARPATPVIANG